MRRLYLCGVMVAVSTTSYAQNDAHEHNDSIVDGKHLHEVTVTGGGGLRRMGGAVNGVSIGQKELFRAACCNLGESFVTNPSVDVSYTDAATGAKQIKLLGLSGTYVQMLTENIPNFRGVALPYALGYVPGTWMKSIQVSKGCSSVKNGFESMTGQINVEYLKPEDTEALNLNIFGDTKTRLEANIDGNVHINNRLSTVLMGHFENAFEEHDDNGDGFYDKPKVRQYNIMNRWLWHGDSYIFHGGASLLHERRSGGQMEHGGNAEQYAIGIETDRYEGYMKHAFILNQQHGTNIALMASATMQEMVAEYGRKRYYANEKNVYASLVFETNFTEKHNLSAGLSFNHDYIGQSLSSGDIANERENVAGAYAQYTLNLSNRLTAMAGVRADHSDVYGTFFTPRFHFKYVPTDILTLRLSAGKGYRTVHALAENNYLLSSGRQMVVDNLRQEEAWNYGANASLNLQLFGRTLRLNAEYYYTNFAEQAVVDYDSDPTAIHIANLDGKSYSHTLQVDATYPLFSGFTLTAAYRLNDVKTSYGGELKERPLTSRYKGLVTAQYKTPLEKWQFDVTLQLNGGGRMPTPYRMSDGTMSWNERFGAFEQLSAQVTREFRRFSVYVGGENLTGFKQSNPIVAADRPWSSEFEPTLVWGPVHGRMFYAGVRLKLQRQ